MSFNPSRPQRMGNFRDLVVWQEKVGDDSWTDRTTEPARVEPLKGAEKFDVDTASRYATADYRVFTRYRRVPDTANWRLLWVTGHQIQDEESPPSTVAERLIMDIESVANVDERRRYLEIVVTNTDTASFPPVELPPVADGAISNPGDPFTSTDGWFAVGGSLSVKAGGLLGISSSGQGSCCTEIATTIGNTYRFTVEFSSAWGDTTLAVSNSDDASTLFAQSDPIGEPEEEGVSGTFYLDFTATAATTYAIVQLNLFTGDKAQVVSATCGALS